MNYKNVTVSLLVLVVAFLLPIFANAGTQTGGGYTISSTIHPVSGLATGTGGYQLQSSGSPVSGVITGTGGYTISSSGFATGATPADSGGGSSGGGGGGGSAKKCPTGTTGKYPNCAANIATTTPIIFPTIPNALSCSDTLNLANPIRYGAQYINNPADVRLVERFLNTYEGTSLAINGVYEYGDYLAVVKWQEKYSDNVLKPWGITAGTGYVWKTSREQMLRQLKAACANVVVNPLAISCTEDIFVINPVRYGFFYINNPTDVKTVERFLNTYEGEALVVNGIYEKGDYEAVVRWQEKYADAILTPWGITKGTGYVFTTSIAQMKRQQKATCNTLPVPAPPVIMVSCPFFTLNQKLGSQGEEVKKIQEFLNREMGSGLVIDGNYDYATEIAVKNFQKKYSSEVLNFWSLQQPTGNWYQTTKLKANNLVGCFTQ